MEEQRNERMRIECTECPFSETVDDDGERPADIITEHGRETGHKLTTEAVEEG